MKLSYKNLLKMKNVKNELELIAKIESDNYYYRGQNFSNRAELEENAKQFFNDTTAEYEDRASYYSKFGLQVGECFLDNVKNESFFNEESNCVMTVHFIEGCIDSGVPADSYFYGFYITD